MPAEGFFFLLAIASRFMGLFLVSPIFAAIAIPATIRLYLAVLCSLLMSMVLFPLYLGPNAQHHLPAGSFDSWPALILLSLIVLKEVFIGYIAGVLLSIVLEAMSMAGELIDGMVGFSAAQFFDPLSRSFQSLFGQLLLYSGGAALLLFDFHLLFIRLAADSFSLIPLGGFHPEAAFTDQVIAATGHLFTYSVQIAAIPIAILACGLVGLAFTVRVIPEMNLLLVGLPVRALLGFFALAVAIGEIFPLYRELFAQILNLTETALRSLIPFKN